MKSFAFLTAAFAILLSSTERGEAKSAFTPCLVQSDTASIYRLVIETQVTMGDSARLVALGLPYKPAEGVTLVTDSLLCEQAVSAYNNSLHPADSSAQISAAYVYRVGSSNFVVAWQSLFVFFDANFQKLASVVG